MDLAIEACQCKVTWCNRKLLLLLPRVHQMLIILYASSGIPNEITGITKILKSAMVAGRIRLLGAHGY